MGYWIGAGAIAMGVVLLGLFWITWIGHRRRAEDAFASPRALLGAIAAGDGHARKSFECRYYPLVLGLVRLKFATEAPLPAQSPLEANHPLCPDSLVYHALMECLRRQPPANPSLLQDSDQFRAWILVIAEQYLEFHLQYLKFHVGVYKAARIQTAQPPAVRHFRVELAQVPSRLVLSGDCVVFRLPPPAGAGPPERELTLMLGDAVHHGLLPALETGFLVLGFFNSDPAAAPSQMLRGIHDQWLRLGPLPHFQNDCRSPSALVATLETCGSGGGGGGVVRIANAGIGGGVWHVPMSGPIHELPADSPMLGLQEFPPGTGESRLELSPGDQVVLSTDGLSELPARSGKPSGPDLRDVFGDCRGPGLHDALLRWAIAQRDSQRDPDDVTFVTITYLGPDGRSAEEVRAV